MRVLSGIQPTGNLHLGNYLGAIRNWVTLQQECPDCFFCMVDQHAITQWQDPGDLRRSTRELAAACIAAGIDPEVSVLFHQSAVPGHAQLAWVLSCVARIGWLNRMTQFKDKAGKNRENASVGLYTYPVLMAADVLLYQATHVPVGEDQKQHIELARDIAIKFNADFGIDLFPIPEPVIQGEATRIMSLRDGRAKMSKSDPSDYARINLSDDAEAIALKIRKAKTDPHPLPEVVGDLEGRPEARNLVSIYAALKGTRAEDVLEVWGGHSFSAFKADLSDLLVNEMAPLNAEWARLMSDPGYIESVLRRGAERARSASESVLNQVYDAVGFLRP